MLTSALEEMVKEANIVILHWSLCIQFLKSLKNGIFNLKFSLFGFLNHCPKDTGLHDPSIYQEVVSSNGSQLDMFEHPPPPFTTLSIAIGCEKCTLMYGCNTLIHLIP